MDIEKGKILSLSPWRDGGNWKEEDLPLTFINGARNAISKIFKVLGNERVCNLLINNHIIDDYLNNTLDLPKTISIVFLIEICNYNICGMKEPRTELYNRIMTPISLEVILALTLRYNNLFDKYSKMSLNSIAKWFFPQIWNLI